MPRREPARQGVRRSDRLREIAAAKEAGAQTQGNGTLRQRDASGLRRRKLKLPELPVEILLLIINLACENSVDLAKVALVCKRLAIMVCSMTDFRHLTKKEKRRALLTAKLNSVGLELRADSVLCDDYIYHNDGSLKEIVPIMLEMRWYFECTSYENDRIFKKRVYHYHRDEWDDEGWFPAEGRYGYSDDGDTSSSDDGSEEVKIYIDSERGKLKAKNKWAEKQLRKRYFVSSAHVKPESKRPPETLWEDLDWLLARKLWYAISDARDEIKAKSLKGIYRALDEKYPGKRGTKFSKLAKEFFDDQQILKLFAGN